MDVNLINQLHSKAINKQKITEVDKFRNNLESIDQEFTFILIDATWNFAKEL